MDKLVKDLLKRDDFLKTGKLLQARLHAQYIRSIMSEYSFYLENERPDLKILEDIGEIFGVEIQGQKIYPKYQFNISGDQLYGIGQAIKQLRPEFSDYELFFWFIQPNMLTHEKSPLDYIIKEDMDSLNAVIKAEINNHYLVRHINKK